MFHHSVHINDFARYSSMTTLWFVVRAPTVSLSLVRRYTLWSGQIQCVLYNPMLGKLVTLNFPSFFLKRAEYFDEKECKNVSSLVKNRQSSCENNDDRIIREDSLLAER